mmetsp:Transcript_120183/g.351225  ORF Transcript_120183/g.351225 Transcript_120183/m.351225 type:complete len:206 (-) Transcript_120183:445-1062(-)
MRSKVRRAPWPERHPPVPAAAPVGQRQAHLARPGAAPSASAASGGASYPSGPWVRPWGPSCPASCQGRLYLASCRACPPSWPSSAGSSSVLLGPSLPHAAHTCRLPAVASYPSSGVASFPSSAGPCPSCPWPPSAWDPGSPAHHHTSAASCPCPCPCPCPPCRHHPSRPWGLHPAYPLRQARSAGASVLDVLPASQRDPRRGAFP